MNETKQAKLRIEGMTCGACVRHVTAALQRTNGVTQVRVGLEGASAVVEHAERVPLTDLIAVATKEGYSAIGA